MPLLITFKVFAAIGIFLTSLIAGFLWLKITKNEALFLRLGESFAGGVFLSVSLLHLLPEADRGVRLVLGNNYYPLTQLICITVFVLLLITERGVLKCSKRCVCDEKVIAPFFLVLLLTVHSLVEGAAIGISGCLVEASILFIAVIAHKGSESFALAVNLRHHNLSAKNIRKVITTFSFITPLGIFISSLVMQVMHTNSGNFFGSIFNAVAAGTFLYLGVEPLAKDKKPFGDFLEILALGLGVGLMALVAFCV